MAVFASVVFLYFFLCFRRELSACRVDVVAHRMTHGRWHTRSLQYLLESVDHETARRLELSPRTLAGIVRDEVDMRETIF